MIYHGDCLEVLKTIKEKSVSMVFADPPYFLSNGGKSIRSGRIVSVDKGEWDKPQNYSDTLSFTLSWIRACHDVLADDGTIWISGTHHNISIVESALKSCGFWFINAVVWHKEDPPPLIYKTKFRFSYETLLWYGKGRRHCFNYNLMFNHEKREMDDVWTLPAVSRKEKQFGYHPTQKPETLLERIILASTMPGDLVLDPFLGSGTTCVVAKRLGRKYIGIEKERAYYDLACRRLAGQNVSPGTE